MPPARTTYHNVIVYSNDDCPVLRMATHACVVCGHGRRATSYTCSLPLFCRRPVAPPALCPRQVERRSEKNVVDLLTELNENNKALVKEQRGLKDNSKAQVEALNTGFAHIAALLAASANDTKKAQAMQSGAGTKTETGGVAFNPFTASVSALGGDKLRITFPKTAELIADAEVEMYQCKFTYLKNGKLDAKQVTCVDMHTRTCSAPVLCRLRCAVPSCAPFIGLPRPRA